MSASSESSRNEQNSPAAPGETVVIYEPAHDDEWDDDDDMELYEPASETTDDFGESDIDESHYHDAEESLDGLPIEIEFEITDEESRETSEEPSGTNDEDENEEDEDEEEEEGEQTETENNQQQAGQRRPITTDGDDDDDEDFMGLRWGRRRRRPRGDGGYPKVPSEEGKKLMDSGTFGLNDRRSGTYGRKKKLAYRAMMRELGLGNPGRQRSSNNLISQSLIPSSKADMIINYNDRCYSGQFSDDGNFFFSCAQDFRVRMYDTSNPYRWRYYKTVNYLGGQWTITDATLSPDNRYLAYSSIRSQVCLAPTDPDNTADPYLLEFSDMGVKDASLGDTTPTSESGPCGSPVMDESILRIEGHDDDVNAVCFGDKNSPHILYSGSDDTTLKVWDRRSMADGQPAGVFLGHTEGLTYIDSKGDGRYVLSNAKDQTMKLWDLRKMIPSEEARKIDPRDFTSGFDYRFTPYDESEHEAHPHDCSLVTFRGHKVLKTLIRCHFSPPGSTDGRYVYSGSYDGSVYIWNMDATLAGKVNVYEATRNTRPAEDERYVDRYNYSPSQSEWSTIVRDASWHPNAPVIAATSWNGWGNGLGTCTVHSWNDGNASSDECDDPKMGARVDATLKHQDRFYASSGPGMSQFRRTRLRARMGGLAGLTNDDDDE
ncbi:hypothetical protein H2203_005465 [Taxawa tesnikishii (nom. ined.)]|nr:hypothetical protein H2203_005465 [Dothideales sp. JES 119]